MNGHIKDFEQPLLDNESQDCEQQKGKKDLPIKDNITAQDSEVIIQNSLFDGWNLQTQTQQLISFVQTNFTMAMLIVFALFLVLLPGPSGLSVEGWGYTKLFIWVIVAVILEPFDQGAVAFLALGLSMLLGQEPQRTFSAFGSEIPWLVVSAMFLSVALRNTGLSRRLSYYLVQLFGKTQMSLAYAFLLAEFILAPGIPSVAARGGTVIMPLVLEASQSIKNHSMQNIVGFVDENNAVKKFYLMNLHFGSVITSGIFLTGNHPNLLVAGFVKQITGERISWVQWFIGSSVPGILALLIVPVYTYYFLRVKDIDVTPIQNMMSVKLEEMGPMKWQEMATAVVMVCTVTFWVLGSVLKVDSAAVSIIATMVLISMGVMSWDDCLKEKQVWNTQIRIATLISLANMLREYGAVDLFVTNVTRIISILNLDWKISLIILISLYYYLHYMFASNISHASALYQGFVLIAMGAGSPPYVTSILFAYITDVQGCLTHYGNSLSPIVYSLGEVSRNEFLLGGLLMSFIQLFIWIFVGGAWWKFLGYW